MKAHCWRFFLMVTALACCSAQSAWASGGGDEFSQNNFAPQSYPTEKDLPSYAAGQIGVVPPTYWRVYQFLAYRAASGQALNASELKALKVNGSKIGAIDDAMGLIDSKISDWHMARTAVSESLPPPLQVAKYGRDFSSYGNCLEDAFRQATLTLQDRLKTHGMPWTAVWLANQDVVFANCGPSTQSAFQHGPPPRLMPAALAADAPAWLHKDHAYQTASALFYAGKFEPARAQFLIIGKDKASPWQPWGDYLAARCLMRQASLEQGPPNPANQEYTAIEEKKWRDRMEQARKELATLAPSFAPARQLLGYVDARVRPEKRLNELARRLSAGRFNAESPRLLADYLLIMDRIADNPETYGSDSRRMLKATAPLTRWIGAMQAGPSLHHEALAVARQQWKDKQEPHWLMPLLAQARVGELSPEEIQAAETVMPDAPAYVHLQYHLARLAVGADQMLEADARINAVLEKPADTASIATRNRLLGIKMLTAPSAEGFFAAAQRTLAEAGRALPITDESSKASTPSVLLADNDYHRHLYRRLSLAELQRARPFSSQFVGSAAFADVVWTRAIVLADYATADAFTAEVMRERGTTEALYRRYIGATDAAAKRDAAMLIMVNAPELHPNLIRDGGVGGGWDCGAKSPQAIPVMADELDSAWPQFLSSESRAQATKEQQQLLTLPKRSDYLAPLLLDYASRHPKDPEVPKALHYLVASTRMECPEYGGKPKRSKSYSQQVFELLHKRYPRSD